MAALSPTFPKGLRVLLVDDEHSMPLIASQLCQPELQYAVTTCSSSTEALAYSRAGAAAFDVILAESKLVAADEVTGRAFVDAFEDTPVVLMSEGGEEGEVMRAVMLGAVDFMEKPLSVLKLKNIWQHAVRRMMQRTTLYDSSQVASQAFSEPLHHHPHHAHPSISDTIPSSMTAPIGVMPPLPLSCLAPPQPHRSSVDSPGTPSAGDADPGGDSVSADSARHLTSSLSGRDGRGARISTDLDRFSLDLDMLDEDMSSLEPPPKRAATALPRAPLAVKPSSFGPIVPVPPLNQWPQLPSGCVWGTPLGGPLPPPMPSPVTAWTPSVAHTPAGTVPLALRDAVSVLGPPPAPVLIRSEPVPSPSGMLLPPAAAACDLGALPDGFLASLAESKGKRDSGPLGLKLRKSSSLLDLINSALAPQQAIA